ncbi:MAG: magnesium-protoporphyrin IX monomethyl ester anaerobic oxidative cyclase [Archangium sp.]|nr:magnesium-protoporphyrin IX monomethyl ester anaerobic oxidative cyclase [Archangium sp.]
MRVLLLNPPHTAIGSRCVPDDHLPPLGLLSIGGPLIDAGHHVELHDADLTDQPLPDIVDEVVKRAPEVVLIGHTGSTSAHPTVAKLTRLLKERLPALRIVYGGVFPTYHWKEVLAAEPQVDVIVRGEGEMTVVKLLAALQQGTPLLNVRGIAFMRPSTRLALSPTLSPSGEREVPFATPDAEMITDLDACRVGWELIDFNRYHYWGKKRAVVMQFSRGCPHLCSYCGQRGFWTRWRHRSPKAFAKEIAWLHREHGVQIINLADENPTSQRKAWKELCEALIEENIDVELVGSTRAGDIVRDADLLHLYKKAGVSRFLLGTESTDEETLARIKKGSTTAVDMEAIRLLREHDILSLATWVVGFEEERASDYWRGFRQLLTADPDQVQLLYVTPHRWTAFFEEAKHRRVIQTDQRRWDYKHQVLATRHLPPWLVITFVKAMEVGMQLRPKAWKRLFHHDRKIRDAQRWYYRIGRRVWFHEWANWLFEEARTVDGPSLEELWGKGQVREEFPLTPAFSPLRRQRQAG